jgi:hypothetical protein
MLLLKHALLAIGWGLVFVSGCWLVVGMLLEALRRRRRAAGGPDVEPERPLPVRVLLRLSAVALAFLSIGSSLVVVPNGMAGIRVSQLSGTIPGTLYPGVHFVKPLVEEIALYDVREHVLLTDAGEDARGGREPLRAQSKEGLAVGLAVSIRYRLDPQRLDYVHANLPPALAREVVPRSSPASTASSSRTTWSARSSPRSARRSGRRRKPRSSRSSPPTRCS